MDIGKRLWVAAAFAAVVVGLGAGAGRASGPEVGGNVGVAIPTGDYADTADVGGTIGLVGGYRFTLAPGVALGLIAQPQFTLLPTKSRFRSLFSDLTSMAILAAGPKLVVDSGRWFFTVGGQGGYYRDMSGPLDEDGAGWNVFGDISYEVADNATLGIYGRYDQANLLPKFGASDNATRRIVMAGITFNYFFDAPAEVAQVVTPTPPPPPPPPVAKKKLVLRGVNFDFDKSTLQPAGVPILQEAAKILKDNPAVNVQVQGYTDSIGTDAYNLRLSDRRAATVKNFLVKEGVASTRLTTKGFGESNPVATNETAEGRAQNRRVELIPSN